MFGIGATELMVILVVALVVFGPKRLPELARSLGKGLAEFRRASSDLRGSFQEAENSIRQPLREAAAPPTAPAQAGDELPESEPAEAAKEDATAESRPEAAAAPAPKPEKEPSGSVSG